MTPQEIAKIFEGRPAEQKVLIIEDHQDYAGFLSNVISSLNYECEIVYSPKTALKKDITQFSTAIVDWNFPGQMTGIDCGICLRDRNPEIRIIIHTGFTDITIAERCRALGFEVIPKT